MTEWNKNDHNGWGNSINIWGEKKDKKGRYRIYGFLGGYLGSPRMQNDDTVIWPMQSGQDVRFVVSEVEYKNDPGDMFFAYMTPLEYVS